MKLKKKELILCFITYIQAVFIHLVCEKTYETLKKLCKDDFNIPIAARAAVIKFWQANGKFKCQENILPYDKKKVWHYI